MWRAIGLGFTRGKEGKREGEKERGGCRPFLQVLFGFLPWGRAILCGLVCLPPMAHMAHIFPPGVPVTPRYSDMYTIDSVTHMMS